MNSPRLSGNNYNHYLSRREDELQRQLQETDDQEQLASLQELSDGISEVREGARKAGVSLGRLQLIDQDQESGSSALGVYERQPDHVGDVGLAEVEHFVQAKGSSSVAEKVEATLKHEIEGHQGSHKKALDRGTAGLVSMAFGEEDALALDEAAAMSKEGSNALSNKPAEYQEYERRTSALARRIGMSRAEIIRLFSAGKEDEIAMAA